MKKSMRIILVAGLFIAGQSYIGTAVAMNGKPSIQLECPICLEHFNKKNDHLIATGKCNHKFHLNCISAWEKTNKNCPLCKLTFSMNLNCDEGANRVYALLENSYFDGNAWSRSVGLGLLTAVVDSNIEKVRETQKEYEYLTKYEETPLQDQARILLHMFANHTDPLLSFDKTPLMIALESRNKDIVKALLEFGGVDANAKDPKGKTVLRYAVDSGDAFAVAELVNLGARIEKADVNATKDKAISALLKAKAKK